MHRSVRDCLRVIGVTSEALTACDSLHEEFTCIKRVYHKKILQCHPDKGGDAAVFREVRACFEVLRKQYQDHRIQSFVQELSKSTRVAAAEVGDVDADVSEDNDDVEVPFTPSWEFYREAAQEEVPIYRMEEAKSGRSRCRQTGTAKKCGPGFGTGEFIPKGDVRIGSIDLVAGTYTRWIHLSCWRVPKKVWLGLPDPDEIRDKESFRKALLSMNEVLLCGFGTMGEENQYKVVDFVMDKSNWANASRKRGSATVMLPPSHAVPKKPKKSRSGAPRSIMNTEQTPVLGKDSILTHVEPQKKHAVAIDTTKGLSIDNIDMKPAASRGTSSLPMELATQRKECVVIDLADDSSIDSDGGRNMEIIQHVKPTSTNVAMAAVKKRASAVLQKENMATSTMACVAVAPPSASGAAVIPLAQWSNVLTRSVYRGKRFVLTGIFPEVGGGVGLNLGKDRVKAMIESQGGKVTSCVSGKTDFLVVGQEPGMSKVSKARHQGTKLVTLSDIQRGVHKGVQVLEQAPHLTITSFSAGYQGNGLALTASRETLAIAAGKTPLPINSLCRKKETLALAAGDTPLPIDSLRRKKGVRRAKPVSKFDFR